MAKSCMVNREIKRMRMVNKFSSKRTDLKPIVKNSSLGEEEVWQGREKLNKLPRDANPIRMRNRCAITGRAHGYYRKFGLSRNKLREAAMRGDIPGLVKASW